MSINNRLHHLLPFIWQCRCEANVRSCVCVNACVCVHAHLFVSFGSLAFYTLVVCTYAVRIWHLGLFLFALCVSFAVPYVHIVCVCPYVADAFFCTLFVFLSVSLLLLQCLCLLVVRIHSGFIELTLTLNEFLLFNFLAIHHQMQPPSGL